VCDFGASQILSLHKKLDQTCRSSTLPFVSGWRTKNPYVSDCLDAERFFDLSDGLGKYEFMSDSEMLANEIANFHYEKEGISIDSRALYVGPGSSSLIFSVLAALKSSGVEKMYAVAPVYYTFLYIAGMLDIEVVIIGGNVLIDGDLEGALATVEGPLLVSDPIWIYGRSIGRCNINVIKRWQQSTGELVIVDGTFQFMPWSESGSEHSPVLDPQKTIRLICPTRSLCVHGVRFAYVITPLEFREKIRYACANVTGANSSFDSWAARMLISVLRSENSNRLLADYVRSRFFNLLENGLIYDPVVMPDSSYYAFVRLKCDLSKVLTMNCDYFGVKHHKEAVRLNLLAPYDLSNILDG